MIINDLPTTVDISIQINIRQATIADVKRLEWFGQFAHYRNLFRRAFREQQLGHRLMLIADCNQFPVGCLFIAFNTNRRPPDWAEQCAYLYSLRVFGFLQGHGIGTRLILEAEQEIVKRGYSCATIAVAKSNHRARRLYERLGYVVYSDDPGQWHYPDHLGRIQYVNEPCWLLQKAVGLG
ncbi:MAG: GNAT family N-acetyltransferase [Anaerolineae bacterium]